MLIALAIGAMAAQPYWLGHLGQGSDTNYHAHRLWQVWQMIREGYVFSRWTPDLAYGYGMPLFNAHGPLPYYLAAPFVLLTGQVFLGHLLALIVFSLAVSVSTYLWLRDHFDEWGGLVGAAAFVFASYPMSNVGIRGTLGEPVAYIVLPLIVWATERVLAGQRKFVWVGALAYAALALNHNITLLIFTPALLIYGAALFLFAVQGRARWVGAFWVGVMLMWGLALATFYVAPAFLEKNDLTLDRIFAVPGFDYHFNFISLQWLFSNPVAIDVNQLGTAYPEHVGATATVLAALALLALLRRQSQVVVRVVASAIIVLLCVLMMLPQAVAVWDALPLLRLLQHARRFLPLASLWMALLVAAGMHALLSRTSHRFIRAMLPALAIGALAITAFPLQMNQSAIPLNTELTAPIVMQREESAHEIGTTSTGEYLPAANKKIPSSEQSPLLRGGQRLDPQSLPATAKILQQDYKPFNYDVTLESTSAFDPIFTTFVYPGWSARVDGLPIALMPTQPYGFMQVHLAAGTHRIQIEWGSTPLRTTCNLVSILAGLLWLGTALLRAPRKASVPIPLGDSYRRDRIANRDTAPVLSPKNLAGLARFVAWNWRVADLPGFVPTLSTLLVLLGIFAFKSLLVDPAPESPWRNSRFDGQTIKGLSHPINVSFDHKLNLLGAEHAETVSSGEVLLTTLYWRVPQKTADDYSTSLQLVDANGTVFGVSNYQHPGGPPTGVATSWMSPNQYLPELHKLRVYPGTPPGRYSLRVQVFPYDQFNGKALPVLNEAGSVVGVSYGVGEINVTRPNAVAQASEFRIGTLVSSPLTSLGDVAITLIGFDSPPTTTRTGDRIALNVVWRAHAVPNKALQFKLMFEPADGANLKTVFTTPMPLVADFETTEWRTGDIWRGTHAVRVPPQLGTGAYTLSLQLESQPPIALGRIAVSAPLRVMTLPAVAMTQTVPFGERIALVGYDLDSNASNAKAGQPLALNLVWKSLAETSTSYKVFVHLVDAAGKLVASDDAVPAQWQRPTTGWLAGEFIFDGHTLILPPDLSPGNYSVQVGLYEEGGAGLRLKRTAGEEFVLLSQNVRVLP